MRRHCRPMTVGSSRTDPSGAAPILPPRRVDTSVMSPRFDVASPRVEPVGARPIAMGTARRQSVDLPEPVRLRPVAWARWWFVAAAALLAPAEFVATLSALENDGRATSTSLSIAMVASGLLFLAVLAWSWVNVDNCRRLMASSRQVSTISPWRASLWWMAVIAVGGPLFVGVRYVDENWLQRSEWLGGDSDVAAAFVTLGWLAVVMMLWTRPYLYLGRVMRRVHGESMLFVRWIWQPFAALVGVLLVALTLALSGLGETGANESTDAGLFLVLSVVPFVVWTWSGWKAMTTMDETVRVRSTRQHEARAERLAALGVETE